MTECQQRSLDREDSVAERLSQQPHDPWHVASVPGVVAEREGDDVTFETVDAEHFRQYRAERVRAFLEEVWGNAMPDSQDPVITVLVDAVAADDLFGAERGLVVQGDGLTYQLLAEVVHRCVGLRPESVLSPRLLAGLRQFLRPLPPSTPVPDVLGLASPPSAEGAWELDRDTGVLTWCRETGRLIGADHRGGSAPWDDHVRATVHPGDHQTVHTALEATWTTGRPYEVRFRTRLPDDTWSWRRARGHRLHPPSGTGPRVVGMLSG